MGCDAVCTTESQYEATMTMARVIAIFACGDRRPFHLAMTKNKLG